MGNLFGARYYDARTQVWQSPDPILGSYLDGEGNGGVQNPFNLSLYTYSHHNPVKLVDPDGKEPLDIKVKAFFQAYYKDNFNNVDVQYGPTANFIAENIFKADAVTLGNMILFNKGQYVPNSQQSVELIGHELSHVQDYRKYPSIPAFIASYLSDYFSGKAQGKSDYQAYKSIPTEKKAYKNQADIGKFLNNNKDVQSLIKKGDSSYKNYNEKVKDAKTIHDKTKATRGEWQGSRGTMGRDASKNTSSGSSSGEW